MTHPAECQARKSLGRPARSLVGEDDGVSAMRNSVLRYGLAFGALFGVVGIAFVFISVFTDIGRPLWLGVNQIKGVVCFGLCGLAGLLVARRTKSVKAAMLTGMLAGAIGGVAVPAALYALPYGFIDHVRQYPFEHYSYLNSGATNIREYLLSARGRETVTSTSIGLMPIVSPLAAGLGAILASLGGWIGRKRWLKKVLVAAPVALAVLVVFGLWSDARRFAAPLPMRINAESAAALGKSVLAAGTVRIDSKGVEQVWVPPGCFRRGADPAKDPGANWYETPEHDVCLTQGFWFDKYEVTNALYQVFVHDGGYLRREYWSAEGWRWKGNRTGPDNPPGFMDPQQPRVWVSWYEAVAFASWRGGQLPTEAQWEYAARGPESRIYPWGDQWDGSRANTSESGLRKTVAASSYENGRSWCGAFNLAGNAWEWTADWYDSQLYRQAVRDDPPGPKISTEGVMERVLRGGAWGGPASSARAARRARDVPSYRSVTIGMRISHPPGG